MVTLSFDYAKTAVVLTTLAAQPEPGSYDMCALHAEATSVPHGWGMIRAPREQGDEASDDALHALADAVRAVGLRHDCASAEETEPEAAVREGGRAGHLRLIVGDQTRDGAD